MEVVAMKKIFVWMLVLMLVLSLCACNGSKQTPKSPLLPDGKVTNIKVTSLPEGHDYAFSGEDADAIVAYLSNLNLESEFKENPDEYTGMTWVIALEYESRDAVTVYHFGNMFIRAEKGDWYQMTYEEASRLDTLLEELND
jgi:predicted small lipoprotein YifL